MYALKKGDEAVKKNLYIVKTHGNTYSMVYTEMQYCRVSWLQYDFQHTVLTVFSQNLRACLNKWGAGFEGAP